MDRKKIRNILIVGGAGYIGSHVNKELSRNGYKTIVLDNLSTGSEDSVKWGKFIKGDLGDTDVLDNVFKNHLIDAVMHFAAYKAVAESMIDPRKYYQNNVINTINLLNVMMRHKIDKFVFSSSAATYGDARYNPVDELHPQLPMNPYGRTKLMIEQVLMDYYHAYGFKSVSFRYFNAVGADRDSEIGERSGAGLNLIPLVFDAVFGRKNSISIFGTNYSTPDGTCVRDYIHVSDLAMAHIKALSFFDSGGEYDVFNLGNGKGFSVREVIDTTKKITGVDFNVIETDRRAGDSEIVVADSSRAQKVLGWSPEYTDLRKIIETVWKWENKKKI
ncbi:MAG: UDP-glucose 4-epimerase GalE [Candidatus Shapirobacteria bacterium]